MHFAHRLDTTLTSATQRHTELQEEEVLADYEDVEEEDDKGGAGAAAGGGGGGAAKCVQRWRARKPAPEAAPRASLLSLALPMQSPARC